jgi:hypothetical protein
VELATCNATTLDFLVGYELEPDLSQVLPDGADDPLLRGEMLTTAAIVETNAAGSRLTRVASDD